MLSSGEGEDGDGVDAFFLDALHELGVTRVFGGVERDERLLMLPDPACGSGIDGQLSRTFQISDIARFENVKAHGVAERVVKDQSKEIEGKDRMQTLREFVKEGLEIPLLSNGLADIEQGLELASGMLDGRRSLGLARRIGGIRHEKQNNTAFAGLTTGVEPRFLLFISADVDIAALHARIPRNIQGTHDGRTQVVARTHSRRTQLHVQVRGCQAQKLWICV